MQCWRCLLPVGGTKLLSSRLLSDISSGSTTGFRRTAAVSTVRTGNRTAKCTLCSLHTHSSPFCYMTGRQLQHHLQGELVCHWHKTRFVTKLATLAVTSWTEVYFKRYSFVYVGVTAVVELLQQSYSSYSSRTIVTAVVEELQQSYNICSGRIIITAVVLYLQQLYNSYSSRTSVTAVVELLQQSYNCYNSRTRVTTVVQ